MSKIKSIIAREVLNASGMPTLETTVGLDDGSSGTATIPSGVATGTYEAYELRDHDAGHFEGQGIHKALTNITTVIAPKLINMDPTKQQLVDRTLIELDGTQNKDRLGANTILSVSIAVAKAAAMTSRLPVFLYLRELNTQTQSALHMPTPLFTLMSGGAHAENGLNFQEFMMTSALSVPFHQALEWGINAADELKNILKEGGIVPMVSSDGGFSPQSSTNADALTLLTQAITQANLRLGLDVFVGINIAANSFHNSGQYRIADIQGSQSAKNLTLYYESLIKKNALIYLEDPYAENDWDGWKDGMDQLARQVLLVGNDLTATNVYRLQMVIDKRAANGIVIQPSQVGTIIESLSAIEVARAAGMRIIIAERNYETNDDFIADFAVAAGADYCKFGGPFRGEHVAKYNKLLRIEDQLSKLK